MFVMTIDQRGSRKGLDLVPELLNRLASAATVLPFERTVGDEVQGLISDPVEVIRICLEVLRDGQWSVGIGAGAVRVPLPSSTRDATGAAFILAREAVEAAKKKHRPQPVAVRGTDPGATDAQAILTILASLRAGRSPEGWEAGEMMDRMTTQREAAKELGISQQALSKRLSAARWAEDIAVQPTLARLLADAQAAS